MEHIYHLIIHRPKSILLLLLVLTGFFAYHARHIRLDSSVESLLAQDDPEHHYYEDVLRLFGSDEVGVVGLITDNIYTPEVLQQLRRLTAEIAHVDGVARVTSLSNEIDPVAAVAGEEPDLLLPEIPATVAAAAEFRKKLAEYPVYLDFLVSRDGRAAAVNIVFADLSNDEFIRRGTDDAVQALVDRENATAARESRPERLYYAGLPHFKVYSANAMWRDLSRFVPLMLLLSAAVLFFSFRSFCGVFLPTLTVVVSLIWTLGIMVLAGSRISLGSMALPPLVLVIGIAYSLHVVAEYYEVARPGRTIEEVVRETVQTINAPALMAACTTVLGFLSQVVNPIVSIREMGIYSSLGISLAFIFSIILVPAVLALLRLPARRQATFAPGLSAAIRRLTTAVMRRRGTVIAVCSGIVLLAAWQIPAIQVDSDFRAFFRATDPIRQATDIINDHLAGSMGFHVVVDGNAWDIMKKWETLRRLKDFQDAIDKLPGVGKTISFADYCQMIDKGVQEGAGMIAVSPEGESTQDPPQEKHTTLWENPAQLNGVMQLLAFKPEIAAAVVNREFSRTTILVRTSLSRSSDIAATVDKIHALAAEILPPELKAHVTGGVILLTRTTGDIVSGQIQSLGLTAGIIFVLMATLFLSARVGVLAMIPNLFPIVVFFGLMGVSGVVLNAGTNIIASIALGLAVDDTIHIMHRLSAEVRATEEQEQALLASLSTVGKPALYYSLLLFLGFLTLGFSAFVSTQQFGLLSATTIVVGVAGELLLLPALLATTRIITLWDLLYLKLGQDPQRTIRLFDGLRPFQAKLVTLMGELKSFPRGQYIIRQGEMGHEMYVVVNGQADAYLTTAAQPRHLGHYERGDVFGEMGLIRHRERAADVIATEEVEVRNHKTIKYRIGIARETGSVACYDDAE